MTQFVIDLTNVESVDSFVDAFNEGFCHKFDSHLHSMNMDAINDYFSWPDDEEYRILFRGWHNASAFLDLIHTPSGRTYRELLLDILSDYPDVQVTLG